MSDPSIATSPHLSNTSSHSEPTKIKRADSPSTHIWSGLFGSKEPEFCHCQKEFTSKNKKYKCKRCNVPVCNECAQRVYLPMFSMRVKQRVCPACYRTIRNRQIQAGSANIQDASETDSIDEDTQSSDSFDNETANILTLSNGLFNVSEDFKEEKPAPLIDRQHSNLRYLALSRDTSLIVPNLRVVFILVGSHGDVQPYVAFGKELEKDGHSVRIATHEHHRKFVEGQKLEFYPIAGDPAELMEFMVENQLRSLRKFTDKITHHRQWVKDLCKTSWEACTQSIGDSKKFYRADVIIANPPSFVGIHIAERLYIPLIMSFTMPWTPTSEFPSPFINSSLTSKTNQLSYFTVDRLIWMGIRDIINDWRVNVLNIPPIRTLTFKGHRLLYDLQVPYIYCFSEQLLPRPKDWGEWIGISGFFFLDTKTDWEPPEELTKFLEAGDPPVFVGFGSIVVADPKALSNAVLKAISMAGCRAIVQKGWANMEFDETPDNVFVIGPAPHDWLFEKCAAVVHHGGAGTTAAGLRLGKPTIIVPFFGDQFFWGATVAKRKLGPTPVPHSALTSEKLADAIKFALSDEVKANAEEAGKGICDEDGLRNGLSLFNQFLPLKRMHCEICPTTDRLLAVTFCEDCQMQLCSRCCNLLHITLVENVNHTLYDHEYIRWNNDRESTIHSKATSLHAGRDAFQDTVGTSIKEQVTSVSDSKSGVRKIGSVAGGVVKLAGGVASGVGSAMSHVASDLASPPKKKKNLRSSSDLLSKANMREYHPGDLLNAMTEEKLRSLLHSYYEILETRLSNEDFEAL